MTTIPWAIALLLYGADDARAAGEPCAGPLATLECLHQNFEALATRGEEQFWAILRANAPSPERCTPDARTVAFLALADVRTVNAEFQEFFGGTIERLCVRAPQCMREAATRLNPATLKRLRTLLETPVTVEDPGTIVKARCLPDAPAADSPKDPPRR